MARPRCVWRGSPATDRPPQGSGRSRSAGDLPDTAARPAPPDVHLCHRDVGSAKSSTEDHAKRAPGRQYRVTDTGCQSELVAVLTTLVEPSGRDSTIEPSAASATVATPSAASCSPKERETARRRIAASSFVLDGLAMPPVLHREALYPSGSAVKPAGADVWKGRLVDLRQSLSAAAPDSLRLVRGSLEGDRFEQRTTGRLALPKGTDLRRVSMCSHDGDLHVFVAAAWLKASTARVHRPSRTWTSRCDRYCSGFSEFIRPWRGHEPQSGSCPSATRSETTSPGAGRPRSRMCPSDRRRRSARGVLAHGQPVRRCAPGSS